jgi:hypothetical protein
MHRRSSEVVPEISLPPCIPNVKKGELFTQPVCELYFLTTFLAGDLW